MTTRTPKMVTLDEVESVWGNANFGVGNDRKMDVVKFALLKCASGYYQGHTSRCIAEELGLITKHPQYRLTKRGQFCLFEFFGSGCHI